jgi:hypothetical protein
LRGECPRCHADVLVVDVQGTDVVVEPAEVIPEAPCPQCRQVDGRGHARSDCLRCGKSGRIGEPLPLRGVAVNFESGHGRVFEGEAFESEAVYHFHSC